MDKKYICYCGVYCENCAVKAMVEPLGKALHQEMKKADFEQFIHLMPNGRQFWSFLTSMAEDGICVSCRDGSGNPDCAVRHCAKEKKIEMCPLCDSYPCEHFNTFFECYPMLKNDNALLGDEGIEKWSKLQDERRAAGYTYSDEKNTGAQSK